MLKNWVDFKRLKWLFIENKYNKFYHCFKNVLELNKKEK